MIKKLLADSFLKKYYSKQLEKIRELVICDLDIKIDYELNNFRFAKASDIDRLQRVKSRFDELCEAKENAKYDIMGFDYKKYCSHTTVKEIEELLENPDSTNTRLARKR